MHRRGLRAVLRRAAVIAGAAALGAFAAATAGAQPRAVASAPSVGQQSSGPEHIKTTQEARQADALRIAADLGWDPTVALANLETDDRIGQLSDEVRTSLGARFAEMFIDHDPSSRLTIRVTGQRSDLSAG